jgi:hypothetical protein
MMNLIERKMTSRQLLALQAVGSPPKRHDGFPF